MRLSQAPARFNVRIAAQTAFDGSGTAKALFGKTMSLTQYLSSWSSRKREEESRRARHRRHAIQAPRMSGVYCVESGRFEEDHVSARNHRAVVVQLRPKAS